MSSMCREAGILWDGRHVLVLSGSDKLWADEAPELTVQAQQAGMVHVEGYIYTSNVEGYIYTVLVEEYIYTGSYHLYSKC
jgi:hypothetical protein